MSIVIPRSAWGAKFSNGFRTIGLDAWLAAGKELWLHHSVTNAPGPDATFEEDCAHMRLIEQIGQNNFGGGISYTWVVMPSGRVFEGHSIDKQGAHTANRNDRSRAICLAGNYDVVALPQRMMNAVALLLRELNAALDGGHRDVYPTACPGRFAYPRVGEINNLAASGQPIEGDDEMANLNAQRVKILNAPEGEYEEMADIALGAATGNIRSARVEIAELREIVDRIADAVLPKDEE